MESKNKSSTVKSDTIVGVLREFCAQEMLKNDDGAIGHDKIMPGDKVRLNVKQIRQMPSWGSLNVKYRQFVNNNEQSVFTAKPGAKLTDADGSLLLVEFEEDPTWLFAREELIRVGDGVIV